MMKSLTRLLKRAYKNSSNIVWAVNLNHILWGWYFLAYDLPAFYVGTVGFTYYGSEVFWGVVFIAVALLSIISNFFNNIFGTVLMLPQQMVITYGVVETAKTLLSSHMPGSLILSLCWFGPLALMHTIAIVTRYNKTLKMEIAEKMIDLDNATR